MRLIFALCLPLVLATSGCTTKSKAQAQAQAAFSAGQQQAAPMVHFRGEVRKFAVPWTEELTLSQGLLAAEYTGIWDPHTILVIRNGQTFKINPKRLLSGQDDPALEPGDVVEVRH